MKKAKFLIVAILALTVFVCCFAACQDKSDNNIAGVYKFYSITMSDGMTYKSGDDYGTIHFSEDFMSIELKKDGTCIVNSSMGTPESVGTPISTSGTWEKEGKDKIIITSNEPPYEGTNMSMPMTIKGNELIFTAGAAEVGLTTIVFKKA